MSWRSVVEVHSPWPEGAKLWAVGETRRVDIGFGTVDATVFEMEKVDSDIVRARMSVPYPPRMLSENSSWIERFVIDHPISGDRHGTPVSRLRCGLCAAPFRLREDDEILIEQDEEYGVDFYEGYTVKQFNPYFATCLGGHRWKVETIYIPLEGSGEHRIELGVYWGGSA